MGKVQYAIIDGSDIMKIIRQLILSSLMLSITACYAPPTVTPPPQNYSTKQLWFKEGNTASVGKKIWQTCLNNAYQSAPIDNAIIQNPSHQINPEKTTCTANRKWTTKGYIFTGSNCKTKPATFIGGETYSKDLNESIRVEIFNRCMESKGYQNLYFSGCNIQKWNAFKESNVYLKAKKDNDYISPEINSNTCVGPLSNNFWMVISE